MLSSFKATMKRLLVLVSDALLIAISFLLAYALRFNTLDLSEHIPKILYALSLILFFRLLTFILMGLYRGMWRFVGIRDLILLIKAVTVSSGIIIGFLFLFFRLENYPRSVFIIDWLLLIILIGGSRFSYRLYREGWFTSGKRDADTRKNILIVGAGRAGELILREVLGSHRNDYHPIGFVDDDRKKHYLTIHGCRVLGYTRDIPRIVHKYHVHEIVLAIPFASIKAKRRIMHVCRSTRVKIKILPSVAELLNGTVKINTLHEIQIEDLLGRAPVKLDTAAIAEYVLDKTILITGAGGSIGSELCRQVAQFSPRRLVLYESSEFNLYQIEMDLREGFPHMEVVPLIGTILNQPKVERTLKQFMPDVVFHAAAYKHVPLMELNVEEALENNAFGTWIMAHLSQQYGVKKFVMVSTDKAVKPVNIMGVSKRIAELICQGVAQNGKTQFVTVRFGNVLNSVGSVIPRFRAQIAKGGPITVTHPDIYRYFMTIPEAVQLIMQAGAMGKGGEVFILDMGDPIKIADLARDMVTLSGLEPDKDIKILFTGLRPGEKLFEELLTTGEHIKSTLHEKIKIAEEAKKIEWVTLLEKIKLLLYSLQEGISGDVMRKVKEIVPEFQPENGSLKVKRHSLTDGKKQVSRSTVVEE